MEIIIWMFNGLLVLNIIGITWMLIEMHNAPTMDENSIDNSDKEGDD